MRETLVQAVNGNAALVRRGRFVNTTFLLEIGEEGHLVRIVDGAVVSVAAGVLLMPAWDFALRFDRTAWEKFMQPRPPAGFTDIFALQRKKLLRMEGNLQPLMANLLYFKDVLASLRAREAA
ncbi:MAG: hypothetical protein IT538_02260 [Variibacter sp.]|nr:hypothetical protein [Variibacter sp.]